MSQRSVQLLSSRPDLCQNSPAAGQPPAPQDQQPGPGQAAPLPGLEPQPEPPGRGGDQTGGRLCAGQGVGAVWGPGGGQRHPAGSAGHQPDPAVLALQAHLPALLPAHLSHGLQLRPQPPPDGGGLRLPPPGLLHQVPLPPLQDHALPLREEIPGGQSSPAADFS